MTIWFIISLLYISVYAGLFARGDASNSNRPKLFTNWMIWLRDNGYFYIRDHVFSSLFLTPLYSLPFLYYFNKPLWWAAVYAIGVCLGGLSGWKKWFSFNEKGDYWEGVIRMAHYAALFIPLGYISGNLLEGFIATLLYAFVAPLVYWYRAKRMTNRYRSQYAEAVHALMYTLLSAWVVL